MREIERGKVNECEWKGKVRNDRKKESIPEKVNSRCCCINACSTNRSIRASARLRDSCRDHIG